MSRQASTGEQFWREILLLQASSGLSVRQFCQRECLGESTFYFWKQKLQRRTTPARRRDVFESPPLSASHDGVAARPSVDSRSDRFVPVTITEPHGAAVLEIVLDASRVIRVARGCDFATLDMVLTVLEQRTC